MDYFIKEGGALVDYTLMHKNIPVVNIEILSDTGRIVKLYDLAAPEHLPLGVLTKDGVSRKAMDDWWTGRSIPASRDGIADALSRLHETSTALLVTKCYGLSLSDQYWVCPKGFGLKWEEVNFFGNDFSKDMGEILFGHNPADPSHISLMSPDNTSDGWLKKKWVIAEGKRVLMKGGSGVYGQEPFNEVIASRLCQRLGISHVDYTLTTADGKPYSLCENFVTPDTELVPAWRVKEACQKDNRDSEYTHLLRCCETFGISGVKDALDRMLTVDYIIANEDRHYNNFGFLRNADTLEWIGFAPIYDSGTSLWYNTQSVGSRVESKPFRKDHAEQIKLVTDLGWFDSGALDGFEEDCAAVFAQSETIDVTRRGAIAKVVTERIGRLRQLQRERGKPSVMAAIQEHRERTVPPPHKAQEKSGEREI